MGRVTERRKVIRIRDGAISTRPDTLVAEEPLEIRLNGKPLAITMRTPGDDYELAAGFLYNEGVIHAQADLAQMTYCVDGDQQEYNSLRVQLRAATFPELPSLERHFFTTSACGVCGTLMLDDLAARDLPPIPASPVVSPALLAGLPDLATARLDIAPLAAFRAMFLLYALTGAPRAAFERFPIPRNTAVFAPTFEGQGMVRSDDITQDPRYGHNPPHNGQPKGHLPVLRYVHPDVFARFEREALAMGFRHAAVGALVRSSYHAD